MEHILLVDDELKQILAQIEKEARSETDWATIESSDMFQSNSYCGGFDATEMEFCFSYFVEQKEYWFQFPLSDVRRLIDAPSANLPMSFAVK